MDRKSVGFPPRGGVCTNALIKTLVSAMLPCTHDSEGKLGGFPT